MIHGAVVLCCLLLFIILCWMLEERVGKALRWLKHTEDRVSSLEVKEYAQDERLDQHDQRFGEDERALRMLGRDVSELGNDVGWVDDKRKTEVIPIPPRDDDNNPV